MRQYRESDHPRIHRRVEGNRERRRRHQRHQSTRRPDREQNARQSAGRGQQQALEQQLTDQTATAGADREANRDLTLSAGRAREQQPGEVRARNQQDDADDRHQGRHHRQHQAGRAVPPQRLRNDRLAFVLFVILPRAARRRHPETPAPARATHRDEAVRMTCRNELPRCGKRSPDMKARCIVIGTNTSSDSAGHRAAETFGRDADDRERACRSG